MTGPLLSLEGVSKTYWRGAHELCVLRNVSLDLYAGDFIAVFGTRSAGKTTLLKVAAGIEPPDEGTVRFDGRDLATLRGRALARLHRTELAWIRRSGPLSQEVPAVDYVALPLLGRHGEQEARRLARRALADVGAESVALDGWASLSDSERALVALAHGLVRSPRVMLVDDPTAGLDVIERERVVALLRSFADERSIAVLMVVPDLSATMRASDVLSLSDGHLIASEDPPPARGILIDFPGGERSA